MILPIVGSIAGVAVAAVGTFLSIMAGLIVAVI
ncbi:hypothetical protein DFR76_11360 [Nocardia pseudobrasiliensis]|uniref:Uncharacterized protein n=1 Tax=Nocardia pseudobrasiliensis TaxID=45979 RepID=A0A370HTD6_9NOCA|nr:hypothetical protein DFR76_11360 [Nocardia pseudobrasiliensis]